MRLPQSPCCFVLLMLIHGIAPAGELITNGSFETNLGEGSLPAGWTSQGSGTQLVKVTGATADSGSWSVRTTNRSIETDGLRQNITTALGASGNGVRRWCRAHVRVDAFASVRVLLRLTDAAGQQPDILLAEQMVRTPGQWVTLEGGSTITWSGALVNASVRIEVQQLSRAATKPATELPDYYLDDLTLDDDGDGDYMLDREEAAAGFSPTAADTDGDGLPDRWELDHGFSPLVNEAAADTDGDGFTNREEFWAASDPRDAASYPGKPANPNANAATRSVLRWLALLPAQAPGRHLIAGQHVSDLISPTEYPAMIDGLASATGKYPAILSLAIEQPTGNPLQINEAETRALAHWQAGGIPMMKWAIYNPWNQGNAGDQSFVDIPGLLNPAASTTTSLAQNQLAHDRLLDWMTQVGDAFERLQQQGVVVMFRPISEMNGGWFWWGHRAYGDYAALWDYLYDYFTNTRGLNNLIWTYESASTEHAPSFVGAGSSASDYYYPGDDRVDAMCHNLYSGSWVLPWDGNRIHARYPKIYGIPQAGPDHANRTGTFDNLTYLNRTEAALPRSSFFIVWNSFNGTNPTTGVSSYQFIGIADNVHASELMNDAAIVTRETVPANVLTGNVAPTITDQPASLTITAGSDAMFAVTATGTPAPVFQWRRNGMDIGNATASTFSLTGATAAEAGDYTVVVSNTAGTVTSDAATLTVTLLTQTIAFSPLTDVGFTTLPMTLTASASSGLPVGFAVLSGPAILNGNDLTLTGPGIVTVSAAQAGNAVYGAAVSVERSFEVSANFDSWSLDHFSPEELADPNRSGPNAVYGADGIANLVKYALGLDPLLDVSSGLPAISITPNDWIYTYARPANVPDVNYEVEMSADLMTWTTAGVTHELVSSASDMEEWCARYPLTAAPVIYFRLKIIRN